MFLEIPQAYLELEVLSRSPEPGSPESMISDSPPPWADDLFAESEWQPIANGAQGWDPFSAIADGAMTLSPTVQSPGRARQSFHRRLFSSFDVCTAALDLCRMAALNCKAWNEVCDTDWPQLEARAEAEFAADQRVEAAESFVDGAWVLMKAWKLCRSVFEDYRGPRAQERIEGGAEKRCLQVIHGLFRVGEVMALEAEPLLLKARDYRDAVEERILNSHTPHFDAAHEAYGDIQVFGEDELWSGSEEAANINWDEGSMYGSMYGSVKGSNYGSVSGSMKGSMKESDLYDPRYVPSLENTPETLLQLTLQACA